MGTIGGGNRIGGTPPAPGPPDAATEPAATRDAKDATKANAAAAPESDSFAKVAARVAPEFGRANAGVGPESLASSGGTDYARLSRENPAAAVRVCDGLSTQARGILNDIESELTAVRACSKRSPATDSAPRREKK